MYIYYFGSDKGRSSKLYVYEPIASDEIMEWFLERSTNREDVPRKKMHGTWWFEVKPNPEIPGTNHIHVPFVEGEIYKRSFWLQSLDMETANRIVDDYLKERYLEMQKKMNILKEEL